MCDCPALYSPGLIQVNTDAMVKESGDLFVIPGYRIRLVGDEDAGELQALLEKCVDYCMLVDGHPPGPSAASWLICDCPPGKSIHDKVVLGIYSLRKHMVGVLDALRDYPLAGDWWIGLLLLDPRNRNKGLGSMTVRSFAGWVALQGARRILLGVVDANDQALSFWHSLGFVEVERQPPRQFGNLAHVVITLMLDIPEA
jgi:GNAT superfamily N-acetyltransferase